MTACVAPRCCGRVRNGKSPRQNDRGPNRYLVILKLVGTRTPRPFAATRGKWFLVPHGPPDVGVLRDPVRDARDKRVTRVDVRSFERSLEILTLARARHYRHA